MLNNWHKKERPFLSLTSTTGGAGGFASGGASGLWQWDGNMTLTDPGGGRTGANLANAKTYTTGGMPTDIKNDTTYFNVTPTGIRDIRVGQTGRYRFTVRGASCPSGARGAQQTATFDLTENEVLRICVGKRGYSSNDNARQGAGGTFITVYPETTTPGEGPHLTSKWGGENVNFLMAMGGAAGGSPVTTHQEAKSADNQMTQENPNCGVPGVNGGGGGGGKGGSGGGGGGLLGNGGVGESGGYGGSRGDGGNGLNYPPVGHPGAGGQNGGGGGQYQPGGAAFLAGAQGGDTPGPRQGGFGGGGVFRPWNSNGGGGGGYSGGGGGGYDPNQAGGGGGSSKINTNNPRYVSTDSSWTLHANDGQVVIEKIG